MSMGVTSVSDILNVRIESVVVIGGVFDYPSCAVRFDKRVGTRHFVAVAVLRLGLDVSSVVIFHRVFKLVLGMRLKQILGFFS